MIDGRPASRRVSVVVISEAQAAKLEQTIESLARQHHPIADIVVVLEGSGFEEVRHLAQRWSAVRFVIAEPRGRAARSNLGIRAASEELVGFIEEGAVAESDWIATLAPVFTDSGVAMTGGPTVGPALEGVIPGWAIVDGYGRQMQHRRATAGWDLPNGWYLERPSNTNVLVRRDATISVGGFDENFEDSMGLADLTRRLIDAGWRIVASEAGRVHPDRQDPDLDAPSARAIAAATGPRTRCADWFRALEPRRREGSGLARERARHVILICRWYLNAPDNGIPHSYRAIGWALHRTGNDVQVVAASDPAFVATDASGIVVHGVPASFATVDQWRSHAANEIRCIDRHWPVDVVIAPNWDAEALEVIRTWDGSVVTTVHTPLRTVIAHDPRLRPDDPLIAALLVDEAELMRTSGAFLVASQAVVREVAERTGFVLPADRCAVVPRGLPDVERRRGAGVPRSGTSQGAGPTIVFVGRNEPRKGVRALLTALESVRLSLPSAVLRSIGAGWSPNTEPSEGGAVPEQVEVASLLRRLTEGGALVPLGLQPDEVVLSEIASATVVVVPSRYESLGLVAIEAARAGVPVVASDVGGLAEVVQDGVSGLLVPPDDPPALASALLRLLCDAELNERLGRNARDRYESHFSIDLMALRLAHLPEAWSGHSNRRPPPLTAVHQRPAPDAPSLRHPSSRLPPSPRPTAAESPLLLDGVAPSPPAGRGRRSQREAHSPASTSPYSAPAATPTTASTPT